MLTDQPTHGRTLVVIESLSSSWTRLKKCFWYFCRRDRLDVESDVVIFYVCYYYHLLTGNNMVFFLEQRVVTSFMFLELSDGRIKK